jgi:hypothetical protein
MPDAESPHAEKSLEGVTAAPGDGAPFDGEVQRAPPARRRKLPRMALLAAGLGLAFLLAPTIPRDHPVVLRFDNPATITGVDLAWSRHNGAPSAPLRGATWRFEPGKAPGRIETNARLPTGSYRLELSVSRTDGTTELERTVTLDDSGVVSIPVR